MGVMADREKIIAEEMIIEEGKTPDGTPERISERETPGKTPEERKRICGVVYRPADGMKHPAVIMSHGYNGSSTDFEEDGKFYAEHGIVACAYDFRGGSVRSKSSGKSTEMSLYTEKEDLLRVYLAVGSLEYVDRTKIFLLGASQGGMVTALAAEELGEQVPGIVLYFPAFCIADDWRKKFPSEKAIPETVDFWGMKLGRIYFSSIRGLQIFETIGSYPGNVLILHGDRDPVIPMDYMIEAQKTYAHGELVVLPGEGHGFSPEGAGTSRERVLSFFKKKVQTLPDDV